VPGLQRVAQGEFHARGRDLADEREAELEVRLEPGHVEPVAALGQVVEHVVEVHAHKGGQQEAVVQFGAPAGELAVPGLLPEAGHQRAQQQLLGNAHAGVRRHLEGAQFEQAQAAGGLLSGEYSLSMQNSLRWVLPVTSTRMLRSVRSTSQGGMSCPVHLAVFLDLVEGNFQLVQLVVAGLVHPRCLAGGADEQAAEQVAQDGWLCQ
jgi:hypothetical protein